MKVRAASRSVDLKNIIGRLQLCAIGRGCRKMKRRPCDSRRSPLLEHLRLYRLPPALPFDFLLTLLAAFLAGFFPEIVPLRTAPALKTGRFDAGIRIFSRVRIFIPARSPRLRTSKVPNPVRVTLS